MANPLPSLNEIDLIRSITRESFYDFFIEFWPEFCAEKLILNWHLKAICDELQAVAEKVFEGKAKDHDLIINVPPGSSKSSITSIAFPAWVWSRMPTARFICGSFTHSLSLDLSRKCRDLITSPKYKTAFGITLRDDQNAKGYFVNAKGGMRIAATAGGNITGFHAHFIIVDDPINPNEAVSEVQLKSVNRWMNETLETRKVDKQVTPTILIQQRLHENDTTGARLKLAEDHPEIKIRHICFPARKANHVSPKRYLMQYQNGLLDPARLNEVTLKKEEVLLGEYGFSGQYMQSPAPLSGGMFKADKIKIDSAIPVTFVKLVRAWDKAGSADSGAFTAGIKMGLDKAGRVWILDAVRGQWDSFRREQIVRQTAEADGGAVTVVLEQEPGSGGKESAENTVRNLLGFSVRVIRPSGDKVTRADPFSVQVNSGNVYMAPGNWNADYLSELRYFPFSRYKDQVDSTSMAFSLLTRRSAGGF